MLDLQACDIAGEMLRTVGFERRYTSMESEATYYGWPGLPPVIRVACHRAHRVELNGVPTIANITFNSKNFPKGIISRPFVIRTVATAIGNYMLCATGAVRARARYRNYHAGGRRELDSVQWLHQEDEEHPV